MARIAEFLYTWKQHKTIKSSCCYPHPPTSVLVRLILPVKAKPNNMFRLQHQRAAHTLRSDQFIHEGLCQLSVRNKYTPKRCFTQLQWQIINLVLFQLHYKGLAFSSTCVPFQYWWQFGK